MTQKQHKAITSNDAHDGDMIPHQVAARMFKEGMSPARAWREHLGLTHSEVAERMGVTQPTYYGLEKWEGKPSEAYRKRIADALGVPPDYLDM